MENTWTRLNESAGWLSREIARQLGDSRPPDVGIVLGSGLGGYAGTRPGAAEVRYVEIPHFPPPTNPSHAGRFVCADVHGKRVLMMNGRYHFYEGYSMREVAAPIRVMKLAGINTLIVTNAAGGVNPAFSRGDLMLIEDHIKFFDDSPARGQNLAELGPRFFDMSDTYTTALRQKALLCAGRLGVTLRKGVYAFMPGPQFETPAEIRMLRALGADAVGMSTVPETIAAAHCGLQVLGISCITNLAAGLQKEKLSDEEVRETAGMAAGTFQQLLDAVIETL